jgi:hypothetical protein
VAERRKRQRTIWRYNVHNRDGASIRVGWIHNPKLPPKGDAVRLRIVNSRHEKWDTAMTVLEAISVASGLAMVAAHSGWSGDIADSGFHLELEDVKRARHS